MNCSLCSFVFLPLILISFFSNAGVVLTGTRIIYPANKKEISINLHNTGDQAALVQSWIDRGDPYAKSEKVDVPFVIIPPITRVDGGKGQTLRLIYIGSDLPDYQESIFWLNVLAVPPKDKNTKNSHISVAYQTRVKIFFRPSNLMSDSETAAKKLIWKTDGDAIIINNPTPYFITIVNVAWEKGKRSYSLPGGLVKPFGELTLAGVGNGSLRNQKSINYVAMNDKGVAINYESSL